MYNVIFKNNKKGVVNKIIWARFGSEDSFNYWCKTDKKVGSYEIIEQGITRERAIELCPNKHFNKED